MKDNEIEEIDRILAATRLEVINQHGRLLALRPVEVDLVQFQDDGRTVKIFVITPEPEPPTP